MNVRRLILYLCLNVIVSAATVLTVLWLWERYRPAPVARPAPTVNPLTTQFAIVPTAVPGVVPSPTPALPPASATPTLHVVQFGDTLGSIAQQYDVSMEAIMAANGLTDPDALSVGESLLIPLANLTPTSAPTSAPAGSPIPTTTRDPNAPLPKLTIREVQAPGTLTDEHLVIFNAGGPVDLAGWTLRDEADHVYTFPALTLFQDGAVNLHTTTGTDTVIDLYWNLTTPLWSAGQVMLLSDPQGNLQARFTVP